MPSPAHADRRCAQAAALPPQVCGLVVLSEFPTIMMGMYAPSGVRDIADERGGDIHAADEHGYRRQRSAG